MMSEPENDKGRAAMRWILAAFYAAAGVAHLWAPEKLLAITPSWVPFPSRVIFITGICEILGAAALVTRPLRRWAATHDRRHGQSITPEQYSAHQIRTG